MQEIVIVRTAEGSTQSIMVELCQSLVKSKFKTLYTTEVPIILVFASCWSHYSPINTFLCARGIFAVLALKKERSNLTLDKVFKLNEEQRAYLKMVVDDRMIDGRLITKDLIIAGKYH